MLWTSQRSEAGGKELAPGLCKWSKAGSGCGQEHPVPFTGQPHVFVFHQEEGGQGEVAGEKACVCLELCFLNRQVLQLL